MTQKKFKINVTSFICKVFKHLNICNQGLLDLVNVFLVHGDHRNFVEKGRANVVAVSFNVGHA